MQAVNMMAYYFPIRYGPIFLEEVQTFRRPTVRLNEYLRRLNSSGCLLCYEGIHNTILWYQSHWGAYSLYRRLRRGTGQT